MNTFNKLPPSYFQQVKGEAAYMALSLGEYIPAEWAEHYPKDYPTHKALAKQYKHYMRKEKRK
jgi:hypothetical protein